MNDLMRNAVYERIRNKVVVAVGDSLKDDPDAFKDVSLLIGGVCAGLVHIVAMFSTPGSVNKNVHAVLVGMSAFADENADELEQAALDSQVKH